MRGQFYRSNTTNKIYIELANGCLALFYDSRAGIQSTGNLFNTTPAKIYQDAYTIIAIDEPSVKMITGTTQWPQWVLDILGQSNDQNVTMSPLGPLNGHCEHSFKEYVGLRQSFHYCTKCDKKK